MTDSNLSQSKAFQSRADISFRIILVCYGALILSLLAETLWLNPPQGSVFLIALIQIIPLLVPAYWVLQRRLRAVAWLCFILCFYFTSGVLDVWFRPEQFYGWLTTLSSVTLFITAILFIRWQANVYRN